MNIPLPELCASTWAIPQNPFRKSTMKPGMISLQSSSASAETTYYEVPEDFSVTLKFDKVVADLAETSLSAMPQELVDEYNVAFLTALEKNGKQLSLGSNGSMGTFAMQGQELSSPLQHPENPV